MYCIVLYCIVLYCIVLHCIVLYCIVLYCIVLYCVLLCYVMLCYVMLCYVMLCYVMLCYVILCYIILYYIILYYIILYYIILYYIILYYIILYYIILYLIIKYCIILHHVSLYYIIFFTYVNDLTDGYPRLRMSNVPKKTPIDGQFNITSVVGYPRLRMSTVDTRENAHLWSVQYHFCSWVSQTSYVYCIYPREHPSMVSWISPLSWYTGFNSHQHFWNCYKVITISIYTVNCHMKTWIQFIQTIFLNTTTRIFTSSSRASSETRITAAFQKLAT